jgi:hypothetical protein
MSILLLICLGSVLCCGDVLLESIHGHTWKFGAFGLVEGALKEEPLACQLTELKVSSVQSVLIGDLTSWSVFDN